MIQGMNHFTVLTDDLERRVRNRTAALSGQLAQGRQLQRDALAAKQELQRSQQVLAVRRKQFATLEAEALKSFESARGQALAAGDVALAAGEDIEQLRGAEAGGRAAWAIAAELANSDPAPMRPLAPEGRGLRPLSYQLPAVASVTEGLGSVNAHGVRSRGLTLATVRGASIRVPASGLVRFSGPFRSHDGVVIIDHGKVIAGGTSSERDVAK